MHDDIEGTAPNCPACLVTMTAECRNGVAVWVCPECGLMRL